MRCYYSSIIYYRPLSEKYEVSRSKWVSDVSSVISDQQTLSDIIQTLLDEQPAHIQAIFDDCVIALLKIAINKYINLAKEIEMEVVTDPTIGDSIICTTIYRMPITSLNVVPYPNIICIKVEI